ncbi:MAG: IS3 family transposase [Chlorobium phaeobacteroides]|nr:IS3 family transposase [Chlorobium phaeobacteroides]
MDFTQLWAKKSDIALTRFISWLGIAPSKYYNWQSRYGKVNEHNGLIPRDFWLEEWEKQAIISFHNQYQLDGYRRLTFMMLDRNIVAVSPSSVYRVLSAAGLLQRWNRKTSKKGTGFVQPLKPHEHWHIDVSYVNLCGTFYYLCTLLDGYSRYIVHWELRKTMTEKDIEIIMQRAREKFPDAKPRIISDNGPQFIAKDFKAYIRLTGMSHVRTSPYYPQSNGKLERYHKTIKTECIRPKVALSLEEARTQIAEYIRYYNEERLHSAIGYIAPKDKLEGRDRQIFKERDQKLEAARAERKQKRLDMRQRLDCHQILTTAANINSLTQQDNFSISN